MKILVLSNLYPPDFMGGYEIACAQAVEALRRRGDEVAVLAAAPRTLVADPTPVLRRFQLIEDRDWRGDEYGVHPLAARLRHAGSRHINAHNVQILIATLEARRPDVVYICNLVGLGGLGLIACLNHLKVPWVWQLGDNVPGILCSTFEGTCPTLAAEFSRQFRGHYVVVSRQLLHQIEESGVTLRGDVEVLPNWIVGARPPARVSFFQGGTLRIMSAGQVTREKGIDILIEAAARLRALGRTRFVVDIYGKATEPHFADAIRARGLTEHVHLKGPRSPREIMALYREYDVFAFPARAHEPFGMVSLEAAAGGCVPVIAQCCGIAEWLVHGVHCLKAARTPAAFAEVFRAIHDRALDLASIARRGEAAAWRDFHIDAILPAIRRKLHAAATQSRAGAGTPAEAYRMARLAEQLTHGLHQEACSARPPGRLEAPQGQTRSRDAADRGAPA